MHHGAIQREQIQANLLGNPQGLIAFDSHFSEFVALIFEQWAVSRLPLKIRNAGDK
jgi:hypothetical protein